MVCFSLLLSPRYKRIPLHPWARRNRADLMTATRAGVRANARVLVRENHAGGDAAGEGAAPFLSLGAAFMASRPCDFRVAKRPQFWVRKTTPIIGPPFDPQYRFLLQNMATRPQNWGRFPSPKLGSFCSSAGAFLCHLRVVFFGGHECSFLLPGARAVWRLSEAAASKCFAHHDHPARVCDRRGGARSEAAKPRQVVSELSLSS